MEKDVLFTYWNDIPVGRENAISYADLCFCWKVKERAARAILHELSRYDNGDNYILIRSSSGRGFYRTDKEEEIKAYKRECLNRGRNVFAPVKKINRVLYANAGQYEFANNLRAFRENCGLKQSEVCLQMRAHDSAFDCSLLSKMENGVCLPTSWQVSKLAEIYGVTPFEILNDLYY